MTIKNKKILISAGGTGGHIYPAMGVAEKLLKVDPSLNILFAAGGLAESSFFDQSLYSWKTITAASFVKKNPLAVGKSLAKIVKGTWHANKLLSSFVPDLVIGFGSYHTFPVLLAARLRGFPLVLHEQNSKPGKVIRLFAKRAILTGVYFPSAAEKIKSSTVLLKMPLREGFTLNASTRQEACRYLGINPLKKTILVFGGSLGAKFLNTTVSTFLGNFCYERKDLQILHFTGNQEQANHLTDHYKSKGLSFVVKAQEPRMDFAWRAADFAIVRAGAGTIAEQLEFEVPAIFIPYPRSSEDHQQSNADFVVNHVRGGWKIQESHWSESTCSAILQPLLELEGNALLNHFRRNIALYKETTQQEEFAWTISKLLKEL